MLSPLFTGFQVSTEIISHGLTVLGTVCGDSEESRKCPKFRESASRSSLPHRWGWCVPCARHCGTGSLPAGGKLPGMPQTSSTPISNHPETTTLPLSETIGMPLCRVVKPMQLALVKQIESVEKEFPQQHSPPSNFGTTPQKPYDALKCTALHDVLHFRSEGAAAGMSVHAQYNVIQFIWMNCVQCKAVPYTRVQWRKVYCSSATVHCTVYIIQLYTVVYSSIHTDSTQHTVTVFAEWEPA